MILIPMMLIFPSSHLLFCPHHPALPQLPRLTGLSSLVAATPRCANNLFMPDIVLTTLNARYIHAAFGLRYLLANLGELRPRAGLIEFDLQRRPEDVVEALLALDPKIVGLGVYIWNVRLTTDVVSL